MNKEYELMQKEIKRIDKNMHQTKEIIDAILESSEDLLVRVESIEEYIKKDEPMFKANERDDKNE